MKKFIFSAFILSFCLSFAKDKIVVEEIIEPLSKCTKLRQAEKQFEQSLLSCLDEHGFSGWQSNIAEDVSCSKQFKAMKEAKKDREQCNKQKTEDVPFCQPIAGYSGISSFGLRGGRRLGPNF